MSWIDAGNSGGRLINKRELSEILNVSDQSLTEWQEEGMPVVERGGPGVPGRYDTAAVIRWAVFRELHKRSSMSAKDRLDDIRAMREMIAYKKDIGATINVADIRPAFQQYVNEVLGVILSIPEKYAQTLDLTPGIDGKVLVLQDVVNEIRESLGSYEFCASPAAIGAQVAAESAAHVAG